MYDPVAYSRGRCFVNATCIPMRLIKPRKDLVDQPHTKALVPVRKVDIKNISESGSAIEMNTGFCWVPHYLIGRLACKVDLTAT
jgi:hypothetical protein